MHPIFSLTILFLSLSYLQAEVISLTQDNFQEIINSEPYVFVKFFAPWCGHCKALAPKFESLSNNFPNQEVKFAEFDSSNERTIGAKYQINGYPTLKLFMGGEPINYEGGREENDMKEWILKKLQPAVKNAELSELEQIKKDNQVVIVLYEESYQKQFEFAARQFDDIPFYLIKSLEQPAPMVLYKQFDEGENLFTDANQMSTENIFNFVQENQYPRLMEFSDKVTKRIMDNGKIAIIAFVKDTELDEIMNQAKDEIFKLGLILSIGKWSNEAAKKVGEQTGVIESQLPVIRILKSKGRDMAKYAFEEYYQEINLNNINLFAQAFKDGKVKEYYKSEPIPETQGDVIKVVGKTFQQIVMDRDKDVLVKYYAPWCGHCKALAPIYENIARQLKRNKDLVLAEFDYTANEVEGEGLPQVSGYPTIKFHTRKRKIGAIDFKGGRNEEEIMDFLRKKVTVPWKEPKSKPNKSEL